MANEQVDVTVKIVAADVTPHGSPKDMTLFMLICLIGLVDVGSDLAGFNLGTPEWVSWASIVLLSIAFVLSFLSRRKRVADIEAWEAHKSAMEEMAAEQARAMALHHVGDDD